MGKKNKKGGNDSPKENKNPKDNQAGASGESQPAEKKKDSGQGSKDQQGKQQQHKQKQQSQGEGESKQAFEQQRQRPQGQQQQQQPLNPQGQEQRPQGTWGQQGGRQQGQSQGARSKQGEKQSQQPRRTESQQQQPQGTWAQQGGRQGQQPQRTEGQQQQPQGSWAQQGGKQGQQPQRTESQQQQPQGTWAQQGGRQGQQPQRTEGQQQQPQGTWAQQGGRQGQQPQRTEGQQQQPQGTWAQQGGRQGQQPQRTEGQQQQTQGTWAQQGGKQGQQPQRTEGQQQQPQGTWAQQGGRQGQQPQRTEGQQQQPQGTWGQQGGRQAQQPQRTEGQQQQAHGTWAQQGGRQRQTPRQGQQQQGGQQQYQQRGPPHQGGQQHYRERQQSQSSQGSQASYGQQQQRPQQQYPQKQQLDTIVQLAPAHANSPKRGTLGKPFELQANYLTLNLNNMPDFAYHYDVKIDPERPKKFVHRAFKEYVKNVFPGYHLAYDGKASAYSVSLLPEDKLNEEIEVKVLEDTREIPFKVILKPTQDVKIDLKSLKSYHNERIFDKPMRALQCIEVVLSSPCHEKGIRAGRSFFTPPRTKQDLGDGFELWLGLYQAAMLCDQPLLNVDVSHKSFPSEVNLEQYYDNLRYQNPRALDEFLKGLRVVYTPPKVFNATPRGYKYLKVMDACSKQLFKSEDGRQQTVAEYFKSKGAPLRRSELPCLHVGSSVKNIYIPLELLSVPAGQAIMRKDNENQVRQMIRFAATSTDERKEKIMNLLRHFEYNRHATVESFGLSVGNQFITVPARLLQTPQIEYGGGRNITIDRPGEWMMKNVSFLQCDKKTVHQWAIINISKNRNINELFLRNNFISLIQQTAGKLGMSLASNCFQIIEPKSTPSSGGGYRRAEPPVSIKADLNKLKASKVSIVFVILPYASESYAQVKQEAELSCGIVTQCIKGDTMYSENRRGTQIINVMTVSNILLKVNAKLNGTNHKIATDNEIKLQKTAKIMFVGADVSHPSPLQKNLPSIVGVVASHNLSGTQYNMQYRLQTPGVETIVDMKEIFAQHLNVYFTRTGSYPDHIIYYRDGVSDGQFQLIDKIELKAMRSACQAVKCNAKFTCIIVVKRHHTRFFPKANDGEGKFNNVKAGTVVDRTIIHPNEVQFFMVSHKSIQGTAKPTRYNVIVDDAKIDIDDLQAMTYNLCHLFPRCNRSVSYPAPAYLAHLVGLRGRAYIEGSNLNLENLKGEYAKRIVSNDVMKLNPMYFV